MSKVLVTGGAGFIGSHIVDRLLARAHTVHILDDLSSGSKENIPPTATFHHLDMRSADAARLVEDLAPDAIVHTAAQISVRISMEQPVLDADLNVRGFVNLLTPLRSRPGTHVIFFSSGGAVYGEQESFPAPETHPIKPESLYGLSKRVGEMYLEFWSRVWGVRGTAIRPSNVYGPRQNPHGEAGVIAIFCKRLLAGQPITINGTGDQTRDFVYVEDVAEAVVRALETGSEGPFNVGTGRETSITTIAETLKRLSGSSAAISRAPAREGEQMRSCIDCTRAGKVMGWSPAVHIEDGLARTLEWFRRHG
jgi:UDP-glucose 4-epimerase